MIFLSGVILTRKRPALVGVQHYAFPFIRNATVGGNYACNYVGVGIRTTSSLLYGPLYANATFISEVTFP